MAALPPPTTAIKINEILTGVSNDALYEFVELYNAGAEPQDLTGWTLSYRSSSWPELDLGYLYDTRHIDLGTAEIPAYGYFVIGGLHAPAPYQGPHSLDLPILNGSLAARDSFRRIIDSVGWGSVGPGAFVEGSPASYARPSAPPGTSIQRVPNGVDTGDNSVDFKVGAATIGAVNQ